MLALVLLLGTVAADTDIVLANEQGIVTRRVFGPELPGRYKHPASITELANGDLYLAYYGGSGEYADDTAVYGARWTSSEQSWSKPIPIADTPFRTDGNAVVWQAPDGLVWLFYVTRYGETWSSSRISAKISRDEARTWSDSTLLTFEQGMMVRGRPIILANGSYLLPIYHEMGEDRESVGPESTSLFLRFDPKTQSWSETGHIRSPKGNIQPAIAEVEPGHVIAYCRRGGGYGPKTSGYIVRSESQDSGNSWSEGTDSAFPNPNAAIDFIRLASGSLLLVYNDSPNQRTPLVAALSVDNDKTYPHRRVLAKGPGDFAYPYVIQARDGKIHLIYTQKRQIIHHALFDESAILPPAK